VSPAGSNSYLRASLGVESDVWPSGREIFYLIDQQSSRLSDKLIVDIGYRERLMKGGWGKFKSQNIQLNHIQTLKDPTDRQILAILVGAREAWGPYAYGYTSYTVSCIATRFRRRCRNSWCR
jgi:hypothetical protein